MSPRSFSPFVLAALILAALILAGCIIAGCTPAEPPAPPSLEGAVWTPQASGTQARLQAISIVDANTVWVSGTDGTYGRTTDGGTTWQSATVPGADSLEFRDVHGVDAQTAYLLSAGSGASSRIYKTTDGGQAWTLQFTNPEPQGFFDCFDFWDGARGIAFSDALDGKLYLITTEDGGATWTRIPPETMPAALPGEGAFAASGTCLITRPGGHVWFGTGASGVAARVFHSPDYGRTWTLAEVPVYAASNSGGLYSLAFRDATHGAAFGGDYNRRDTLFANLAHTTDGGATWRAGTTVPLGGSIFGAAVVPGAASPTYVAVAPTGSVLSTDDGATWSHLDSLNYWSVAFHSPAAGWAVGPEGRIARLSRRDR